MLTLSQVEPRTPISSAPFTITQPGSYFLTTNVTIGIAGPAIAINANNTTFDLNGFSISSTNPSAGGTAILLASGVHNITILDGTIESGVTNNGSGVYSGTGFGFGIEYHDNPPYNVRVYGVSVYGCLNNGISLGVEILSTVDSCTVQTAGNYGVEAGIVGNVTATDCGNDAIVAGTVSDSQGKAFGTGYGIDAINMFNSYGVSSNADGIVGANAENCFGISYSGNGVNANNSINCYGTSYGNGSGTGSVGVGVYANVAQNCTGYSYSTNGNGIYANDAQTCLGFSTDGVGINCQTAANCYGSDNAGGTGMQGSCLENCIGYSITGAGLVAGNAIGCFSSSGDGGIGNKYNMP